MSQYTLEGTSANLAVNIKSNGHMIIRLLNYYILSAANEKFILKYIHPLLEVMSAFRRTYYRTNQCFAFEYFTGHLLQLVQDDLPLRMPSMKSTNSMTTILSILVGLFCEDTKAGSIFSSTGKAMARIPVSGRKPVVEESLSPFIRALNKPSDICSFAFVCICAVHTRVIFAVWEEELDEGIDPLSIIIERQISCFADEDGIEGLLKHLGGSPWAQVSKGRWLTALSTSRAILNFRACGNRMNNPRRMRCPSVPSTLVSINGLVSHHPSTTTSKRDQTCVIGLPSTVILLFNGHIIKRGNRFMNC
ncbi:hypothetical protein MGYG_07419 [Nannizzia gypsea CBS 118893]|uniref:Uncharacterized protein n=1 Tax=Arthroderma gypseum (strain ATCC MYA-4604 / CBS 118893) TaxID=535722 RepID=E4V339_ARTGP|nr:hypothetical protein MGYG_07419 [Nannizzia gypsea CBS 118893]EFR04413.1 hypothetical protein MGYG_07419 [Nannizzia gypsea CBS 118893]